MKKLLHSRSFHITITIAIIIAVVVMAIKVGNGEKPELITATVESGTVQQLVSVSGVAEAEQSAELAFPVVGTVKEVMVEKGSIVKAGDVLATLEANALLADRQDALAALAKARANRAEIIAGPSDSDRAVTSETVLLKERALSVTKETEEQKVENAKRTLLSSSLTAYSDDPSEEATSPTISGTYNCEEEGSYRIEVFSSGTASGYSYRLSGLEDGTFVASVDQAVELGTCGLRILFDADSSNYQNSIWTVEIPNTKSASYTTNLNSYNLAVTQAKTAIEIAEQELMLARANADSDNAPARTEVIARTNADVAQAEAMLARIDSNIADRTLRAPFDGTITELNILKGETVTTAPIMTLLAASQFEVTARVPEIDIGQLKIGQKALMRFDAKSDEIVEGDVNFISLKSTEIDGVAYYEALIKFTTVPEWMRSGLNADIEIIVDEKEEVMKVPKRFVTQIGDKSYVQTLNGEEVATSTIEILFTGNDGYFAITGLNVGDTVVAP